MKKKTWIILGSSVVGVIAIVAVLVILLGGGNTGSSADRVFVQSVASIMSGNAGAVNRFTGVVEPERTLDVNRNPDSTISEIFVEVGDEVEVGTPLFEYDTSALQNQITLDELTLEEMNNQITDQRNQITALTRERNQAPQDQRFQYTAQIQQLETSIKQIEFNIQSKTIEIDRARNTIENSVVTSELAGIVRTISETGFDPNTGQTLPFMNILALGEMRIRGRVNEQNIWDLQTGMGVIVRSRISDDKTWQGQIHEIDMNPIEEGNNMWGGPDMPSATNYNFFVTVDDPTDLLLGQHVFLELDHGQSGARDGVWLFEGYLDFGDDFSSMAMDGGERTEAYVWADNGRGRLERRLVQLGAYDMMRGDFEILSGLTMEDYIAFPMPGLYEGVRTVTNQDEVDFSSPLYNQPGGMDDEWPVTDDGMWMEEHPQEDLWHDDLPPGEVSMEEGSYVDVVPDREGLRQTEENGDVEVTP